MASMSYKVCTKCKKRKLIEEFYREKRKRDGYDTRCKNCVNGYQSQYRQEHRKQYLEIGKRWRQANKEQERNRALKKRYGITAEQYNILLESQNERCGLCGKHQSRFKNRLAVDHDHQTNRVRGLLCVECNILLGHLEKIEEIDFIVKANIYRGRN